MFERFICVYEVLVASCRQSGVFDLLAIMFCLGFRGLFFRALFTFPTNFRPLEVYSGFLVSVLLGLMFLMSLLSVWPKFGHSCI